MSLEITHRFKLSCPRHPRYNPERGGEGAISGGCVTCTALFGLWNESIKFQHSYHALAEKIVAARRAGKES
jgi:hypothetical protein